MSDDTSRFAQTWMRFAWIIYGMAGDDRAVFEKLVDKLIPFMRDEGRLSIEDVRKEVDCLIKCYCAVVYEQKIKDMSGERTVH